MKKNKMKLLSIEDFEGLEINPNWSSLDVLAEVAAVALQKLEEEKKMKEEAKEKHPIDSVNKKEESSTKKTSINNNNNNNKPPGKTKKEKLINEKRALKKEKLMKEKALKNAATEEEEEDEEEEEEEEEEDEDDPLPDLPEEFKNRIAEMEGSEVKLVIQKTLYKTDVKRGNNRLSMPMRQIRADFLTKQEERVLNTQIKKRWEELEVKLIGLSLNEQTISLRKWVMKKSSGNSSSVYVLVKTWNEIVSSNNLKENDIVQLWSFRVRAELCFALVKVRTEGDEDGGSSGKSNGKAESSRTGQEEEDGTSSSENDEGVVTEGEDGGEGCKN